MLFRSAEAGFTPVGLHLYATRDVARTLVALERSELHVSAGDESRHLVSRAVPPDARD